MKKQEFLNYFEELLNSSGKSIDDMPEGARIFYESLKIQKDEEKPMFTENGKIVLLYMQEHLDTSLFKARDIAEGLFISSRTVSGAMRKLVTDGFVEKVGQNPSVYMITEKGKNINID